MKIKISSVPTCGLEDLPAEKSGIKHYIRRPGNCARICLIDNSRLYFGDAATVQYGGAAGRSKQSLTVNGDLGRELADCLNTSLGSEDPRVVCSGVQKHFAQRTDLNIPALMYAVSQIVIQKYAHDAGMSIPSFLLDLYGLSSSSELVRNVRILGQTDLTDMSIVEDMYLRGCAVLPHANFCTLDSAGPELKYLTNYLVATRDTLLRIGGNNKDVTLHLDLYGVLGDYHQQNVSQVVNEMEKLCHLASPFEIQVESPVIMRTQKSQYQTMSEIMKGLASSSVKLTLIIDEWCNSLSDVVRAADEEVADMVQIKMPDIGSIFDTIEAINYCRDKSIKTYVGGTSNETVLSSTIAYLSSIPFGPDQLLAKPGMHPAVAVPFCKTMIDEVAASVE